MFRDEYRRQQEGVHADEGLIRRTLSAAVRKQTQPAPAWKPALIAALCVLVMAVPVLLYRPARPDVTSADATATPAPAFSPVGHSTQVDGMTLRYLSSYASDGGAWILLSLQGEAVTDEMTLTFALTSEKTGQTFLSTGKQLHHDAGRRLSTFMVTYHDDELMDYMPIELTEDNWRLPATAWDPTTLRPLPPDDRLTLTLLEHKHLRYAVLDVLAPEELPTNAATILRPVDFASPSAPEMAVLDPATGKSCSPFADVLVSAGFAGGQLHVQTKVPGSVPSVQGGATTSCSVYLLPSDFSGHPWLVRGVTEGVPAPIATADWTDAERAVQLRDVCYDVSPADLRDSDTLWDLYAVTLQIIDVPDNASRLTFTLGEASVPAATEYQPQPTAQAQYAYTVLPDGAVRLDRYIGTGTTVQLPLTLHGRTVADFSRAYQNAAIDHLILPEGVTEIPHSALLGSSVSSVRLPSTLEAIRGYAFSGCVNLARIDLPESLEAIGDCAFASSGLTEITLPATLTHIGDQAFSMSQLTHAVIPEGVTRIGAWTFATCLQLEYVVVPQSVVFIDETAFRMSPGVTLVVVPGSNAEQYAIAHDIPCAYEIP